MLQANTESQSWPVKAIILAVTGIACQSTSFAQTPPVPVQVTTETLTVGRLPNGVKVMMRGPVHQAFAQPYSANESMLRVDRVIPPPLRERPAAVRPIDDERTAQWVPGYWALEPSSESLVWVSGIWRFAPPEMKWVPGYWDSRESTSSWIPGFWVDDRLDELAFVSKPPAPKVTTPLDPAPSDKHFWVEGYWLYQRGEYQWQPGVWAESQPGWVWEPARYVQTPSGWVFVDGYWDYEPAQRGLMFAPLDFSEEVLRITADATRPAVLDRTFSPQVAVQSMESLQHWFTQPTYSHYYYGNYYDPRYAQQGIIPWAAYQTKPSYYDPLFWYYRTAQPALLTRWMTARRQIESTTSLQPEAVYTQNLTSAQLPTYVQAVDTILTSDNTNEFARIPDRVLDDYSSRLRRYDSFTNERLSVRAELGDQAAARVQAEVQQGSETLAAPPQQTADDAEMSDKSDAINRSSKSPTPATPLTAEEIGAIELDQSPADDPSSGSSRTRGRSGMSLKGLQDMRSPDSQRESSGLREGQTPRFSPPRRLSRSLDEGQEGVDIREGRPGDRLGTTPAGAPSEFPGGVPSGQSGAIPHSNRPVGGVIPTVD